MVFVVEVVALRSVRVTTPSQGLRRSAVGVDIAILQRFRRHARYPWLGTLLSLSARLPVRRLLAAVSALLYLLVVGAETLEHAWSQPVSVSLEAHYHGEQGDHDCPPPPHDEYHCPACKLSGLQTLSPSSSSWERIADASVIRVPVLRDEATPSLRSHAPPTSRAPPLG
jgi:hypothetical protein